MPTWWYRCETVKGDFQGSFHTLKLKINLLTISDGSESNSIKT